MQIFLLTPGRRLNQAMLYMLAYVSAKYAIQLHAFCVMSNHYHLVLTDPLGNSPDFFQDLHSLATRCINRLRKRRGSMWEASVSYNSCLLGSSDESDVVVYGQEVVDKCVYAINNPLRATRVDSARKWPGVNSIDYKFGKTVNIQRPDWFFKDDSLPKTVELTLTKPPGFEHLSDSEMDSLLRRQVWEDAVSVREEAKAAGKGFAGATSVLNQDPFYIPPPEPPEGSRIPYVASKCPERRKALQEKIAKFRAEYRAALLEFREGNTTVPFPRGTYLMKRKFGVHCCSVDPHPPP
ncbi:MAG: transposase [Myxococcales bacterium]|nr:transposase [Myxococcales bacterium]